MKIALLVLAGLALLVVAFVVWRYIATMAGTSRLEKAVLARIAPVTEALEAGHTPSADDLEHFAQSRETRKLLFEVLIHFEKPELVPAQYREWPAVAEADLAYWLAHPNELAAFPDEMELMATMPAPGSAEGEYFVFRFRTQPPHWAADHGWQAGVAGPYDTAGEATPGAHGTFSRFDAWDSKSPEQHVEAIHELVAGRSR